MRNTLAYTVSGATGRPVVVFLHGFLGNRGDWFDIEQLLSDQYRVLAIDLPGHGESLVAVEGCYIMPETAKMVLSTIALLHIERFHLVGYSMGGRLALYIALHFPQMVETLILESASPGIESLEERIHRRDSDAELAYRLLSRSPDSFIDEWYNQPLFESMQRYPERLQQLGTRHESDDGRALPSGDDQTVQTREILRVPHLRCGSP